MSEHNRKIVHEMWNCLYQKDWKGVASFIDEHGLYEDVPAPDAGAVGPENVVKRLRLGLDPVQRFEHEIHRVVAEGDTVVVEHTEIWHFETGEKIVAALVHDGVPVRGFALVAPDLEEMFVSLTGEGFDVSG